MTSLFLGSKSMTQSSLFSLSNVFGSADRSNPFSKSSSSAPLFSLQSQIQPQLSISSTISNPLSYPPLERKQTPNITQGPSTTLPNASTPLEEELDIDQLHKSANDMIAQWQQKLDQMVTHIREESSMICGTDKQVISLRSKLKMFFDEYPKLMSIEQQEEERLNYITKEQEELHNHILELEEAVDRLAKTHPPVKQTTSEYKEATDIYDALFNLERELELFVHHVDNEITNADVSSKIIEGESDLTKTKKDDNSLHNTSNPNQIIEIIKDHNDLLFRTKELVDIYDNLITD